MRLVPDPLPPELSAQTGSGRAPAGKAATGGLTATDLGLIGEARNIDAKTWLEIAAWGHKSKAINYTLVGISRTMAELAVGGWEKSPSAKQAKWGLEAYKAFQRREQAEV